MIPADHKKWAEWVFKLYLDKIFSSSFNSIRLYGEIPIIKDNMPLLLIPNHSSWWDGFFTFTLNRLFLNRKFHIMMLEDQLKRYWFFQKLGAFSINRENPSSMIRTFRYCVEIMTENPNSMLNIYPQGELTPLVASKMHFKKGLERIIKMYEKELIVLPVAMNIISFDHRYPDVAFKFGEPLVCDFNSFVGVEKLATMVDSLIDQTVDDYIAKRPYRLITSKGISNVGF